MDLRFKHVLLFDLSSVPALSAFHVSPAEPELPEHLDVHTNCAAGHRILDPYPYGHRTAPEMGQPHQRSGIHLSGTPQRSDGIQQRCTMDKHHLVVFGWHAVQHIPVSKAFIDPLSSLKAGLLASSLPKACAAVMHASIGHARRTWNCAAEPKRCSTCQRN